MLGVAMDYYKNLFGFEDRPNIMLKSDFFFSKDENDMLSRSFLEEEIREVVFSSYANGAPGPDGLSFMFYQSFWDVVKTDLVEMFHAWHGDNLDLYRLNFAMITLIPKENEAKSMKKFRPISLLNCSFKIFTNVLTNILAQIINRLISFHQSAFIRGRYILESIVTDQGLRQGDPIAPLIFNCVVDVFSRMFVQGTNSGLIRGLCPNFIPGGAVSLQYADVTLLFLEKDVFVAFNLK
jgi:hypothetical protein